MMLTVKQFVNVVKKHQLPIRMVHNNEVLGGQVCVLLSLDKEAVKQKT